MLLAGAIATLILAIGLLVYLASRPGPRDAEPDHDPEDALEQIADRIGIGSPPRRPRG